MDRIYSTVRPNKVPKIQEPHILHEKQFFTHNRASLIQRRKMKQKGSKRLSPDPYIEQGLTFAKSGAA